MREELCEKPFSLLLADVCCTERRENEGMSKLLADEFDIGRWMES